MSQGNRNRLRRKERERAAKRRNYKQEYRTQVARDEHKDRMERQRARREMDKKARDNGGDDNNNGVADKREGKDIAHNKPLRKGGTNKDGYRVTSRSRNRSNNGQRPKRRRT